VLVHLINESILEYAGLAHLPPLSKAEALVHLETVLDQRVLVRVVPALAAGTREELRQLYEAGDFRSASALLAVHLPSFTLVAQEEFNTLAAELAVFVATEDALRDAAVFFAAEFDQLDADLEDDEDL
jgi:hypothetical protein